MNEWSEVWKEECIPPPLRPPLTMQGYESTNPPRPEPETTPFIDFTHFTLLMVASGRYPGAGYAVSVTAILQDRGGTIIKVLKTSPGKECVISRCANEPHRACANPENGPRHRV